MKLATLVAALAILFINSPAFAIDLTGEWCGEIETAYSAGFEGGDSNQSTEPGFEQSPIWINITQQETTNYGIIFYGYSEPSLPYETGFSGVWDGAAISITHHDSVTRGTLKGKKDKGMQINFINNVFDRNNRVGKTSVGAIVNECP